MKMASFEEHVVVPVVTKTFVDANVNSIQRGPDEKIIVSEGLNLISLYKFNSRHPLKSWSFRQKNSLLCPVVFDFKTSSFVSAHQPNSLRQWTEEEKDPEAIKRHVLGQEIFCLLGICNSEPVVVYRSGCFQFLSSALEGANPHKIDLEEDQCIAWMDGKCFHSSVHVVFVLENKRKREFTFCCHILSTEQGRTMKTAKKELTKDNERLITWCLNPESLQFYTLWSDKQLCTFDDHFILTKVCTLSWNDSPPFAIAALDEKQFLMAWYPNSDVELDMKLEIWDTRFIIRKAVTYLNLNSYSGNAQMTVTDKAVYIRFDQGIFSIPIRIQPSSLAQALGKASVVTEPTPKEWQKKTHFWKTKGLMSTYSKRNRDEKQFSHIFPDSEKTFSKIWQDNITWLIDKGDIVTIYRLLESYSDIPESVLVDILHFVLGVPEVATVIVNVSEVVEDNCIVSKTGALLIDRLLSLSYSDVFLLENLRKLPVSSALLLLRYLHQLLKIYPISEFESQAPTMQQIIDWISLLLDAHFSELTVSADPQVHSILQEVNKTVVARCDAFRELEDISNLLDMFKELKHLPESDPGYYCIECVEL